jgi:signal transduction histidine kinase
MINRSTEQIMHAINEIRTITQSLVPPSISDLGLVESIKDLVENIAVTKTLEVNFSNVGDIENALNDNQKVMLFRIIQEQVNNVLKHAEAKHLNIQLTVDNSWIELIISDDGRGFNPAEIKMKKGVGLSNIVSRAELFNGNVKIISAPGKGCKVVVKVLRIYK